MCLQKQAQSEKYKNRTKSTFGWIGTEWMGEMEWENGFREKKSEEHWSDPDGKKKL